MATNTAPPEADQVVFLRNVSWEAYEALSGSVGEMSSPRLTYDGETLEIMSPGSKHERIAARIAYLLASVVSEWELNIEGTRSTTFRTKPFGGFEGDDSYYIANAAKVRDWDNVTLATDPPPDLVIEVDISNRRLDKKDLYARIGVSEFWRYDDKASLEAFFLDANEYISIGVSRVIAGLPIIEIAKRLTSNDNHLTIVREWQQWLRVNRHLHKD